MRVIGGEFRSRLLKSVPGTDVRPTPDRLREALFNVLAPRIEKTIFADIYAGTGAVGIEALSRGAARAIFVDPHRSALTALRANLQSLDLWDRAQVLQTRAIGVLPTLEADIFFLDPPYRLEREYDAALDLLGSRAPKLVVVQHDIRQQLGRSYGALRQVRQLRQGDNVLSFYQP
ncbi:MAG TPA: 16S rRNA (guanine(966)-N(2))-methyltransferase RsmD [Bryobacteraceae bacterium]